MITVGLFLRAISMITMRIVLCALSCHVAQRWWSSTEWLSIWMDRGVLWVPDDCILLSCEPKRLLLCWQRPRACSWHWAIRTRMAPCCTTWKGILALFHVFPVFSIESWHALFAPGENKLSSRLATFKKTLQTDIKHQTYHVRNYFCWRPDSVV